MVRIEYPEFTSDPRVIVRTWLNDRFLLKGADQGTEAPLLHVSSRNLMAAGVICPTVPKTADEAQDYFERWAPEPRHSRSNLLRAGYFAYSQHLGLRLRPTTVWFAILHEVAAHVNLNPEAYEGWFTRTPGRKRTLTASYGAQGIDWPGFIGQFAPLLRAEISEKGFNMFLPGFIEMDHDDHIALLIGLMETCKSYYNYSGGLICGIPAIELAGPPEDWQTVHDSARQLAKVFTGLKEYFDNLLPTLEELANTAYGGPINPQFWKSAYRRTQREVHGCGGSSIIHKCNGWLTHLVAHTHYTRKPDPITRFPQDLHIDHGLPLHLSKATVKLKATSVTFVGGITALEYTDLGNGFCMDPRLGYGVVG